MDRGRHEHPVQPAELTHQLGVAKEGDKAGERKDGDGHCQWRAERGQRCHHQEGLLEHRGPSGDRGVVLFALVVNGVHRPQQRDSMGGPVSPVLGEVQDQPGRRPVVQGLAASMGGRAQDSAPDTSWSVGVFQVQVTSTMSPGPTSRGSTRS